MLLEDKISFKGKKQKHLHSVNGMSDGMKFRLLMRDEVNSSSNFTNNDYYFVINNLDLVTKDFHSTQIGPYKQRVNYY